MSDAQLAERLDWRWMILFAVGGMVFSFVAMLLAMKVATTWQSTSGATGTDDAFALLVSSAGLSLGLATSALVAPLLQGIRPSTALGLRGAPPHAFALTTIGMLALGPTSDLFVRLARRVAPEATYGTLDVVDTLARQAPLVPLFIVFALLPGLSEELFFRGLVQRAIQRKGLAITISALTFTAVHADPHHVAGVLPLGFYLAWVAARTGSTWVTITAHVANNTMALAGARLVPGWDDAAIDASAVLQAAGGLVVAAGVVVALNRLPADVRPTPMGAFLPLARRLEAVQPSATVAISQRARDLQAQGIDVLSFSVGEPDFDTPKHIVEAAKKAADEGATRYTAVRGIPALLKAICAASAKRRKVTHDPSEVVVSVGAKHTLYNLSVALFNPGDEVIIPSPYWVSYPEQAKMVDAVPVIVETTMEDGFRLTPAKLEKAITPKTKALILCSPSNPTGAAYSGEQLKAIADVCAKHEFWIIVDEIYAELVYGGFRQQSILEVAPELKDRTIIVDGVSKTFAMTGWRIGWMLAPKEVAKACDTVQGQATTNATAIAQYAALAALTGPWEPMEAMRKAFEERRAIMVDGLNAIPGVRCQRPEGAFYAFPDVSALLGKKTSDGKTLKTDVELATYLLEEAKVAVVPGEAFGAPGHLRISYAAGNDTLREGIRRIAEAVKKLG